ncbi:uncharacterized protein [Hyperolius riggenbachi]|uniref:uncharacterized protein n=1 Tax=Hyperolius riggenbachi TaxID=752182 RepID=UPI0035A3C8ED
MIEELIFMILMSLVLRRRGRQRRFWVHPLLKDRPKKGQFWMLYRDLRQHPDKFFGYARMSIGSFDRLLSLLEADLKKKDTKFRKSVTPTERLLITLRFLATGQSFSAMHYEFRMGVTTIHRIVRTTCVVIWNKLANLYMQFPDKRKWEEVSAKFYEQHQFPNCLGAIDGKHVRVVMPPHSGSHYFNYKKYFSIVLMAVADADSKFLYVDVGAYGGNSDSRIFRNSRFGQKLISGNLDLPDDKPWPNTTGPAYPHTFVADEAFGLSTNLMRPYAQQSLNYDRRIFNYRLSRARKVVECAFGIMTNKWRVFHTAMHLKPANAVAVIKAACILHNYVITLEGTPAEEAAFLPLPQITRTTTGRGTSNALTQRDRLAAYFVSGQGSVPWQDDHI